MSYGKMYAIGIGDSLVEPEQDANTALTELDKGEFFGSSCLKRNPAALPS